MIKDATIDFGDVLVIELDCGIEMNTESIFFDSEFVDYDCDHDPQFSYQNEKHLFNVVDDTEELSRQVKQRMMKVGLLEDQRFGQYFYNRYQWEVGNNYNIECPRKAYEMLW